MGLKKQSKKEDRTFRTIVLPTEVAKALREHHTSLPMSEKMRFPIFGKIDKTHGCRWVEYKLDSKGEPKLDGQGCKVVKTDKRGRALGSSTSVHVPQRHGDLIGPSQRAGATGRRASN